MNLSEDQRIFTSSTTVYKAGEKEHIHAIDVTQVSGQAGVYTDDGIRVCTRITKLWVKINTTKKVTPPLIEIV